MAPQKPLTLYDSSITFSHAPITQQWGDTILLGNWFVFLKTDWLARSGLEALLALSGIEAQCASCRLSATNGKRPTVGPYE